MSDEIVQNAYTILLGAAGTFKKKNAEYGDSYKQYGAAFLALFGDAGLPPVADPAAANRFAVMLLIHIKLHRYAMNFEKGGHADSARDMAVYAAILEELTEEGR